MNGLHREGATLRQSPRGARTERFRARRVQRRSGGSGRRLRPPSQHRVPIRLEPQRLIERPGARVPGAHLELDGHRYLGSWTRGPCGAPAAPPRARRRCRSRRGARSTRRRRARRSPHDARDLDAPRPDVVLGRAVSLRALVVKLARGWSPPKATRRGTSLDGRAGGEFVLDGQLGGAAEGPVGVRRGVDGQQVHRASCRSLRRRPGAARSRPRRHPVDAAVARRVTAAERLHHRPASRAARQDGRDGALRLQPRPGGALLNSGGGGASSNPTSLSAGRLALPLDAPAAR